MNDTQSNNKTKAVQSQSNRNNKQHDQPQTAIESRNRKQPTKTEKVQKRQLRNRCAVLKEEDEKEEINALDGEKNNAQIRI